MAIKSFKSKALKLFWMNDDASKVKQSHIDSISDILTAIEASHAPRDLKQSFSSFEEKKGGGIGTYTIKVNGNWRITFQIESEGAILIDYRDYHGKKIKTK